MTYPHIEDQSDYNRYSIVRGWKWVNERGCKLTTKDVWLEIYQRDEPDIEFRIIKAEDLGK